MPNFIDLTGRTFGRWTVLHRDSDHLPGRPMWLCRCLCGTVRAVTSQGLRTGISQSCGCLNAEIVSQVCIKRNTTHGHAGRTVKSVTYRRWSSMRHRCRNPKSSAFHKYGARGVTVCARWDSFENFLADMGECPSPKHTLDRKDNALGYEPGNCRWATMREQQNNRTNNHRITVEGTTRTLMQWSRTVGIDRRIIARRLKRGVPPEQAILPGRQYTPR